jgi:subtilase family serine protease
LAAQDDPISLQPGEKTNVKLVVAVPETAQFTEEGYKIRVVGTSNGAAENLQVVTDDVLFLVMIELPNLFIKDVDFDPPAVKAQKPVAIKVTIYNDGTVQCDNVNVSFFDKESLAGKLEVEVVAPGREGTVVFTWMPSAGVHNLKFVVDSDNSIVETNEQDNSMSLKKTVESPNTLIPGFEGTYLLVAGAIAMMAVVVVRRRLP